MQAKAIYIWDPLIRIFHWSAVILIALDYWFLEGGDTFHSWAGYSLGAMVVVRIGWGFVGTTHARFADFFPTPARLRSHLARRSLASGEGHNPLGALMILAMLGLMTLIVISGWMQTLDRFWGEPWLEQLHEYSADLLLFIAAVHVLAVLTVQRISGVPLVKPMLTGWRRLPAGDVDSEQR